ncbi:hypothetical protein AGMMS50268_09500 [Spirochaetia bacterium]|nr:hypothetical protein AGMMS50268_09500 [Spirochaetia bacterium]
MASKYAMETVFQLIDKVTRPLDSIGIKSKTVSKKIQRDFAAAQKRLDAFGKAIAKWGKRALLAAGAAVGAFVGIGVKNAIALADTMAKIGTVASSTAPPLSELQKNLTDAANAAGFTVQELADIAYIAIPSGIAAEASADFAAVVAKTAKVTGTASEQIVDGLTTVLNAYGMGAEEAARISGMMFTANKLGKTSFQDMATGMKSVIPIAAQFGVATEDVFASITALTAKGLTTKDAMKTLGDSISAVTHPSKDAAALAQRLGLDFSEAAVKSKGWAGFLEDIRQKTGGNTAILETLFGNEKIARSMGILATTGSQAFSEALAEMGNAMNTIDEQFAKVTDTPAERWKKAINKISNAGTSLGTSLLPLVERVIGRVTEIADRIAAIDFSQYTGTIENVIGVIEWLIGVIIGAVKIAWDFRIAIMVIVGALALYHGALMAAVIATKLHKTWMVAAKIATFAFTLATKGQTEALAKLKIGTITYAIAQKGLAVAHTIGAAAATAFSAAVTANPIGLIIMGIVAAIAALIAIIILIKKNWEKITTAIKNNANKIIGVISVICLPIGIIISLIKEIASNWGKIKDAISATGLFDKIKQIGEGIKNFIKPGIDWLIGIWETVKKAVSSFFNYVVSGIKSFFEPAINWIVNAWHTAISTIGNFFKGIFDAIAKFVQPALSWFSETWQKIVSFFKDNAIVNAIKVIGGTLISGLLAPIQGLLEILSYIPGLGHLAGKGAEKIQEFRNFLKGADGATINANVNVPDSVAAEITPLGGTPSVETPGINNPNIAYPDMSTTGGAGGRSRLHGVADVSGGAAAPMIPSLNGTQTVNSAVSSPAPIVQDNTPQALLSIDRSMQIISALIQNIDTTTTAILNKPPAALQTSTITEAPSSIRIPAQAARTPYRLPTVPQRYIETGQRDRENADREDPRNIPPVSREDRMAYSLQERRDTVGIEVSTAQGAQARITRRPRSPNIKLTDSGGNA